MESGCRCEFYASILNEIAVSFWISRNLFIVFVVTVRVYRFLFYFAKICFEFNEKYFRKTNILNNNFRFILECQFDISEIVIVIWYLMLKWSFDDDLFCWFWSRYQWWTNVCIKGSSSDVSAGIFVPTTLVYGNRSDCIDINGDFVLCVLLEFRVT